MPLYIKGVKSEKILDYVQTVNPSDPNGIVASTVNYQTPTISTFGNLGTGTAKWSGGVLSPNGKIYTIPFNHTHVLEIDPINHTTNLFGNLGTGIYKWSGGVLAPNGKIYGIPYNSTQVLEIDTHHIPKNPDMCLHPYFNKL